MKEVYHGMAADEIDCRYLNGVYREIAEILGIESAMKIYSVYRGQQITFPVKFFTPEFIALKVIGEYDGYNVKKLATKYGYSEKWIRKMIREHQNEKQEEKE